MKVLRAQNSLIYKLFLFTFLFILSIQSVFAVTAGNVLGNLLEIIASIFGTIFSLGWIRGNEDAVLKALLWFTIFAVTHATGKFAFQHLGNDEGTQKKLAVVIAVVMATASAILIPPEVVRAVMGGYAGVGLLLIVLVLVGFVMYIAFSFNPASLHPSIVWLIRFFGFILCAYFLQMVQTALLSFAAGVL